MLETLKLMLGLTDADHDEKLEWLLETAAQRLKILIGAEAVPEELQYIVIEVAIIRYNRIASEGMSANSVEGETLQWDNSDFDGFKNDINAWLEAQANGSKGKVRFI